MDEQDIPQQALDGSVSSQPPADTWVPESVNAPHCPAVHTTYTSNAEMQHESI